MKRSSAKWWAYAVVAVSLFATWASSAASPGDPARPKRMAKAIRLNGAGGARRAPPRTSARLPRTPRSSLTPHQIAAMARPLGITLSADLLSTIANHKPPIWLDAAHPMVQSPIGLSGYLSTEWALYWSADPSFTALVVDPTDTNHIPIMLIGYSGAKGKTTLVTLDVGVTAHANSIAKLHISGDTTNDSIVELNSGTYNIPLIVTSTPEHCQILLTFEGGSFGLNGVEIRLLD